MKRISPNLKIITDIYRASYDMNHKRSGFVSYLASMLSAKILDQSTGFYRQYPW